MVEDLILEMSHEEFVRPRDRITAETFEGGKSLIVKVKTDKESAESREFLARAACDYLSCVADVILDFELIDNLVSHAFTAENGKAVYDEFYFVLKKSNNNKN